MGVERHKMDVQMTYLKNNSIDEAIHNKLRKKDVYETYMHKIYNLILGQKNEQLQNKVVSDATLWAVKTVRDPIGYLMILNNP